MTILMIYESFGFPPWRWGNPQTIKEKPCRRQRGRVAGALAAVA